MESSCIGVAAHIYSAASKGPRGWGGLSKEELKSEGNAIWLCTSHANLIDKHDGREYSPETLHAYKALHETRIAYELAGICTPFGWIDHLKIHSSPLFATPTEIKFAKLTLIVGGNSVGKTALCEWLAANAAAQYLERWERRRKDRKPISVEVGYHNPEFHSACVSFDGKNGFEYKLDGNFTAVQATPLKIIFPGEAGDFGDREEGLDDVEFVARELNLHPYEVRALCRDMSNSPGYVTHVWFEDNDEGCDMYADVKKGNLFSNPRPFRFLSRSERARVLMELGILAANRLAVMHPTLLILDTGFQIFDADWSKRYAKILASPTCRFQTVVSARPDQVNFEDLQWGEWKVILLDGEPPNVVIHTNIRMGEE